MKTYVTEDREGKTLRVRIQCLACGAHADVTLTTDDATDQPDVYRHLARAAHAMARLEFEARSYARGCEHPQQLRLF